MRLRIALIIAALMVATARAQTPTGASLAFTSDDPALAEIRSIISNRQFPSKDQIAKLDAPSDDAEVRRARSEMKEILQHLRHEYSLDAPALLQKVRGKISDASLDDLERWRKAGELQYRNIDGQVRYFRREPSNLWRFCDEA